MPLVSAFFLLNMQIMRKIDVTKFGYYRLTAGHILYVSVGRTLHISFLHCQLLQCLESQHVHLRLSSRQRMKLRLYYQYYLCIVYLSLTIELHLYVHLLCMHLSDDSDNNYSVQHHHSSVLSFVLVISDL